MFELLIDGEEMGDLLGHMGREFGNIVVAGIDRVKGTDGDDLLVHLARIEHIEDPNGPGHGKGKGNHRLGTKDQDVEGIAIFG